MSGVLERMAQRALGALPTVQPLLTPHFAPADRGSRETPLAPNTQLDHHKRLEIDAPPARAKPARPRVREAADEWQRPGPEHGTTSERVAAPLTPAGEEPPTRIDGPELQGPIQPFKRIAEPRVEAFNTISGPNPVTEALVSQEPTPHVQQIGGGLHRQPELRKPAVPVIASEQYANEAPVHLSDPPEEDRTTTLPPKKPGELPPDIHAASPVANRIQRAVGTPRRDRRGAVVLTSSAEQKAEIHISIGRIELRAPRPEVNPPATPFRPHVTLEEFLHRKPEASG
jgi:hypothetical protein